MVTLRRPLIINVYNNNTATTAVVELVVRTMTTRENCRSLFFVVISFLMASVKRFVEFCVFKKHVRTHVRISIYLTHLLRLTKYPFPVVGPHDDVVGNANDVVSTCGVKGTMDLNISGPSLFVYSIFRHVLYHIYDTLIQWCLKCLSRFKTKI